MVPSSRDRFTQRRPPVLIVDLIMRRRGVPRQANDASAFCRLSPVANVGAAVLAGIALGQARITIAFPAMKNPGFTAVSGRSR
jgi:hypothetical protein